MSNTTTTTKPTLESAFDALAQDLKNAGFRPAKWDRPDHRLLDRPGNDGRTIRVSILCDEISLIGFTGGKAMLTEWQAAFTAATPTSVIKAAIFASL